MESLKSYHDHLEDLKHQARKLASIGLTLNTLFTEEAKQLSRKDEASRLRTLYRAVVEQLEQVKRDEGSASYGHSKARLVTSLGGLIAGVAIKMTSKDKQLSAFSDHLLNNLGGKRQPFGTVLVFIGPKGMPDDVEVVSISRLARELNREESDVTNELQKHGFLLLGEKAFSLFIERLIDGVLEGQILLPISMAEIKALSFLKPKAKKIKWVRYSGPP